MPKFPVSIVMLAHNGAEFTRHTLESILAANSQPTEIFLVDNASDDDTPALIAEFRQRFLTAGIAFTSWRNDENLGCSLARNQAWEKASCPYTVLLDNDAPVRSSRWLEIFLEEMSTRPRLGILGPKIVYPYLPHKIQCAGVAISRLGRIAFCGRGQELETPAFAAYRPVKALISACWIMRTCLREDIGYLDELFHPVQYEDLDLCVRARLKGWEVAYTPRVEMYHFEGITTASWGQEQYQVNIARNSLKFRQRYHELFRSDYDDLPAENFRWLPRAELGLRQELDLRLI